MSSFDKKDDKAVVPNNHPIQEHWRNSKLQHTISGCIQLAEEDDAYQAKQLLALFMGRQNGFSSNSLS